MPEPRAWKSPFIAHLVESVSLKPLEELHSLSPSPFLNMSLLFHSHSVFYFLCLIRYSWIKIGDREGVREVDRDDKDIYSLRSDLCSAFSAI